MQQEILDKYKKFDGKCSLIKILVSYIKPSFLFKTKILTPIHLGRKISQSDTSSDDLEWLYENCIGDDSFEGNISAYNRRVGFLTGTWWAYKNYEKLGDPKYFGSFGYRRLLNPVFFEILQDCDIILPKQRNLNIITIKEQCIQYHGETLYQNMMQVFEKVYPQEKSKLNEYLERRSGYFDELYIMKKTLFLDFCEWIFPLLFEYLKQPQIIFPDGDLRDIGFTMERICGYYFYRLSKNYSIKKRETDVLTAEKMVVNKKKLNNELLMVVRNRMGK